MAKTGEKQKRRPKFKDSKQSERFKQAARELGAEQNNDAFERIVSQLSKTKKKEKP